MKQVFQIWESFVSYDIHADLFYIADTPARQPLYADIRMVNTIIKRLLEESLERLNYFDSDKYKFEPEINSIFSESGYECRIFYIKTLELVDTWEELTKQ